MPVAVRISPTNMSKEDYDRVIGELEASGNGAPDGRLHHSAYGDDQLQVFEVWESPEQFDAHRENLFAALQSAGVDAGTSIDVEPLRS